MNKPYDRLERYSFLELRLPEIPPRSCLYHLEPLGIGTPYVESLTSYMVRLARAHSVSARALIIGAIEPLLKLRHLGYFDKTGQHLNAFLNLSASSLNGISKFSQDFVQALEIATLRSNLSVLTLFPLASITIDWYLYKTIKTWCPDCFNEWRNIGSPIYEPLLWQIRAVTVCPIHKRPLVDRCHNQHCQSSMPVVTGNQIDLGYCLKCASWLGSETNFQDARSDYGEELNRNVSLSNLTGNLLENSLKLKGVSHLNNIPILIDAYLEQVTHGNKHEMEDNIQVARRTFTAWQCGRSMPTFPLLLRLAYCSGVSLLDLITLPPEIFKSSVEIKARFLPESLPKLRKPAKPTRYDLVKMQKDLEDILVSEKVPPPSLIAVGRMWSCDADNIRKHFPDLTKAIVKKHRDWLQKQTKEKYKKMRKRIVKAIREIDSKNIYPSYHKVVARLEPKFSLDRRVFSLYWHEGIAELKKRKV